MIVTGREVVNIDDKHFAIAYEYFIETDSVWTILSKFDTSGQIIFKKEYHTPKLFRNVRQLIATQDKGFAFVGSRRQIEPSENNTFYLFKTDSLGKKEWERTYSFEGFISVTYSVQQTPDGGYVLGGYTNTGSDNTNRDMYIVKTDSLGNEEWHKRIGGGWDDCPAIVHCLTTVDEYLQTGEIDYLISGCYIDEFSSSENRYDIYLFKLGTQGELIWEQGYNPTNTSDNLAAYLIMPDDSFYGVGIRSRNLKDGPVLYRFDALGQLLWKKEYLLDTLAHVYMRDIQATEDGGIVLAGFKFQPNPQKSWVLKLDSLGNTCMPADCDSTIVFTDIEETPITQNPFSLSLFPNPASEQVEVVYQIPKSGILKVYDYQGRLIDELDIG